MRSALLLTVASLASVLGAKPTTTEEVKSEAAGGRYGRHYGGQPSYGGGASYGYPSYGPGYWQPLIQDRFVCDLDASVLLVVDSNHHHGHHHHQPTGYYGNPSLPSNRAVRVKCSEVATHDEDSCNFCCQQTARRDTSLANDKLFGFLAIVKTEHDETFKRSKRGADEDDDSSDEDDKDDYHKHGKYGSFHRVDPTYVSEAEWAPGTYKTNVKCVCCAPRTTPAAQNPSGYNNAAASAPSTGYNSNANTFVQPQPIPAGGNMASANQPFVDTWQTDMASAPVAPVAPASSNGNTWAPAPMASNINSNNWAPAPAPGASNTNNWAPAPVAPASSDTNNWAPAPVPVSAAQPTPATAWGSASDVGGAPAAPPAPPAAITPQPIVTASNTY